MSRMSSFLTSGLGTSGGEVFRAGGRGFRLAEAGLPKPEGGLSRAPPLWSVLGGQAGREEELRTEQLPSLGPAGSRAGAASCGAPQHFLFRLGSCSEFPRRSSEGRDQVVPAER